MKEIRYDRQIRLWGDHGQSNIESSSVCVLGSSALASEILKNLVLAGVHKVCIIDDARVQMPDLGQNFFLTWDDVGKYRSERVAESLKVCLKIKGVALASLELRAELEQTELNPSVSCEYRVFSQKELGDEKTLRYLCGFSVVVAANTKIHEGDYVSDIAESLYSYGIPFVYARVCGLLGTIRISVKEHFIFDNHEENPKPDLRLDKPFSTLQQLVSNTPDTVTMSTEELKHTPYLLLYFKALKIYRDELQNPNCFPSTYAGRKHFLECLWKLRRPDDNDSENFDQAKAAVLRSVQLTTIPTVVRDILNDRKCLDIENPQSFWLLCYGLKLFVEKHGVLPLSGTLPDMASDTLSYTKLAKLYHDKSHQDAMEVLAFIREEETRRNVSVTISEQECVHFCKKSSQIRLQRGTSLCRFKELKPLLADILLLEDDANPTPSVWLLLLFASLRFGLQKLRFPGECQNMPLNSDLDGLKQRLTWMIEENEGDVEDVMKKISENSLKEILRFSNSEPHVISSLIGGITAQEVIKLATNQMTFDMYNILDSLEDFGLKYSSAPSLHDKMVQLSLDFNLNEDDLGNTIVAFALNSKKRILDIDLLSLLESELNKGKNKALKERDPDYNITSVKSKPEVESMAHLDNIIGTENRIPLSGSYANFTPVQEASSDISYIQRKNKGDAILTRRGNKFIPGNNSGKATIHGVSTGCDGSVGNDKAAAIIEIKSERLSEFASFFYLSNSEVTNWTTKISPSTDLCCIYGEVIREKNDVFHDGLIHLQLNDENGTVLPVDIKNLKNITIFPGQVIGLTGSIPTGNIFEAKEQLTLKIPRSSSISNAEIEHLKLWVAAGPFTSSHSFSYEPLYDLLELVKQSEPHVLVLMGPFVDRRAKLLSDPAFNEDPEDILNTLLVNIGRELENCKTEVIMQPSPAHDTCSLGVFPAPPLVPEAYIQRHIKNKIHFVPDPAVVNIEGVTLALSGSEIIPHLSKVEYHVADDSAPQIDRITRLSNHILQQRIMYPLSPAAIPSSLLDTIKHAKLDTAPNILILPSVLPPSIKISSDTAICNPGCVLKGKSGMYLTIDINLDVCRKSACDFAESSLFEIVRL